MKKIKFSDIKRREITTIFILLTIVPFFVLASLPAESTFPSYGYDIFFITILGAGVSYALYELNSFNIDKKTNYREFVIINLLTTIFTLGFFFWLSSAIINKGTPSTVDEVNVFLATFDWLLFFVVFFFSFIALLLFSFPLKVKLDTLMVNYVVSLLLSLYAISIVFLSVFMTWVILFWQLTIVIISDTFGYFGGKTFGKTHPFPQVSPKKTTAGIIIGFFSSFLVGIIWYNTAVIPTWANPSEITLFLFNDNIYLIFVILIGVVSPFGDLFFSKIKRHFGKKDFSALLPGHGGIFDRIDGHLFAGIISMFSIILMFLY